MKVAEVDLEEWLLQLAPPGDPHADGSHAERWKREFDEADLGKDGTLSWNEWQVMLFHEQVMRRGSAIRATSFRRACTPKNFVDRCAGMVHAIVGAAPGSWVDRWTRPRCAASPD